MNNINAEYLAIIPRFKAVSPEHTDLGIAMIYI